MSKAYFPEGGDGLRRGLKRKVLSGVLGTNPVTTYSNMSSTLRLELTNATEAPSKCTSATKFKIVAKKNGFYVNVVSSIPSVSFS